MKYIQILKIPCRQYNSIRCIIEKPQIIKKEGKEHYITEWTEGKSNAWEKCEWESFNNTSDNINDH